MGDSYYTDAEMESATGLPIFHVRRLITWGAVSPAKGGKGVVRQWDRHAIRQIACFNALNVAGLSLPMAHTLGMLTPVRFVIDIIDPEAGIRANTRNRWFDPQTALQALEKSDSVVLIADGYSIFWTLGKTSATLSESYRRTAAPFFRRSIIPSFMSAIPPRCPGNISPNSRQTLPNKRRRIFYSTLFQ